MTEELEQQAPEVIDAPVVEEVKDAPVEVVEEPKKLSLGDELRKNLDEAEQRARDEQGRFAKEAKAKVEAKPLEVKPPIADPVIQPIQPLVKAPNAWSGPAKAKFATLPPDIQQEISKREADVEKGFTKLDEDRQFGKQFRDTIIPYMAMIQAEGSTPHAAVQSLLNSAYQLRTATPAAKGAMLIGLAKQYGADLNAGFQMVQSGQMPQAQPAQRSNAELPRQDVSTLVKQELETAQLKQQIDAFEGDAANIHYAIVKPQMAALLQGGQAQNLKEAYDQACWANPTIRSTLITQQSADANAKRVAEAKAKADAARKAGSSVNGSPGLSGQGVMNGKAKSLREQLSASYDELAS